MTALRKGHEIPEVPDVEVSEWVSGLSLKPWGNAKEYDPIQYKICAQVDGILNSIFDGQKMDYRVTREEFVQALYAWLEFQDSRSTIYR